MHIEWGPLLPAAVTGGFALVFYLAGWLPRTHGILTAVTAVFVAAATGLLTLAHHATSPGPHRQASAGPGQVVIALGAALFVGLFVYVVICGNHGKPIVRGLIRRGAAGGAPGAAAGGKSHPKAAHHRSAAITVLAAAFSFLLIFNWGSIWHAGSGGVSQTGSGITQGGN